MLSLFSKWAERGKAFHATLLRLVDADTEAFNSVLEAFALPRSTDDERAQRGWAIEAATKRAIEVPLQVMQTAHESMSVIRAMAEHGLAASVSDAAVGALCARTAVRGAFLNVMINARSLDDATFVNETLAHGRQLEEDTALLEAEILAIVEGKL